MASATLYTTAGERSGDVELPGQLFDANVNSHALYESVKSYLANQRQGTHKTKNRHEVAGQKSKMYRQKGTGRARAGSSTVGNRVGGGRIHGPRPRDYSYALPRKVRRLALRSALSDRAREQAVHVIENLDLEAPSTRTVASFLSGVGLAGRKVLWITDKSDTNVTKSCRNLPALDVMPADEVNAYAVMRSEAVVITRPALDRLAEVFST